MKEYENYIKLINQSLNDNVKNIKLISDTNNIVFRVESSKYGIVYAKFYLNMSSHIDNELYLYNILDKKYLKDVIIFSEKPKFAIFKELRGNTIDEIIQNNQLSFYKEKIIESIIYFYETIGKSKIEGFGLLDEKLKGSSNDFKEFIIKRQLDTQRVLEDYPMLNNAFSKIFEKYEDLISEDNSLVPIDTNTKNIMITESGDVKFIDPGELISGPKLMGYGDFVAHIYKTELYDCLIERLDLSENDQKLLRIYAVFSSLNVLAFLKKIGVNDLEQVIPYGNIYTFCSLIEEHLKALEII